MTKTRLIECCHCGTPRDIRYEPVWLDDLANVYCSQACRILAEREMMQHSLRPYSVLQWRETHV
jgi:hypothetical protein